MKAEIIDGLIVEQNINEDQSTSVKVYNNTEKKLEIKLLLYNSSIPNAIAKWTNQLKVNTWIIPDFSIRNFSYFKVLVDGVIKSIIPVYSLQNNIPLKDKIICLGLNKTGTSSLLEGLKNIGFKVYPENNNTSNFTENFFTGNNVGTAIDFMEQTDYTFFKDIPWSCPGVSEKIIRYTPNSKFILSVRENPEKWVSSVKRFWKDIIKDGKINYNYKSKIKYLENDYEVFYYGYLYGMFKSWNIEKYDGTLEEKLYQVYVNHNNSVRKTLKDYNCDWIEIDVSKEGEHKKLTDWLGIYSNKNNFEHINKST